MQVLNGVLERVVANRSASDASALAAQALRARVESLSKELGDEAVAGKQKAEEAEALTRQVAGLEARVSDLTTQLADSAGSLATYRERADVAVGSDES